MLRCRIVAPATGRASRGSAAIVHDQLFLRGLRRVQRLALDLTGVPWSLSFRSRLPCDDSSRPVKFDPR